MSLLWKTAVGWTHAARAEDYWGVQDHDALFHGSPTRTPPFPSAGRRKDRHDYDEDAVDQALRKPPVLSEVDPRTLSSTQPGITRAGVQHYLSDKYHKHGSTFADQGSAGNMYPVIYKRDGGTNMILSGHHRATAALLQGQMLKARVVEGSWPEKDKS